MIIHQSKSFNLKLISENITQLFKNSTLWLKMKITILNFIIKGNLVIENKSTLWLEMKITFLNLNFILEGDSSGRTKPDVSGPESDKAKHRPVA
jgi:hypothetical protein